MQEETQSKRISPPILFVHGAWHGSWCWRPWIVYFKNAGVKALAADFSQVGVDHKSLTSSRLNEYIEHLKEQVSQMETPPILVGHSLGSVIVQHLAAEQEFPAVVLLAPIPAPHAFRKVFWSQVLAHPVLTLRSLVKDDMSPWTKSRISTRLFFSDSMPQELARSYTEKMHSEPATLFTFDMMHKSPPFKSGVPLMVMSAQKDRFFGTKTQKLLADSFGAEYFELPNSGHDIMLDVANEQAAATILGWLQEKGII